MIGAEQGVSYGNQGVNCITQAMNCVSQGMISDSKTIQRKFYKRLSQVVSVFDI